MTVPRLTLRSVELRSVSIPLKRPVVSKVGLFDRWPLALIDLHIEEGIVGRSYLEPYLERSIRSMRYFVPAIRDLAELRKGRPIAPLDDFRTSRAGLNLIGIEGVSMIAVSGARHGRLEAQVQVRPDGLDPSFRRREATRQDGRDRKRG